MAIFFITKIRMFFNCGHIFAFMGTTFAFSDIYLHMKTHKKAQEGKVAENKQRLKLYILIFTHFRKGSQSFTTSTVYKIFLLVKNIDTWEKILIPVEILKILLHPVENVF